jgi:hypothetical protein
MYGVVELVRFPSALSDDIIHGAQRIVQPVGVSRNRKMADSL